MVRVRSESSRKKGDQEAVDETMLRGKKGGKQHKHGKDRESISQNGKISSPTSPLRVDGKAAREPRDEKHSTTLD